MTARATVWFFMMLALSLVPTRVAATDLITQRAVFDDAGANMTLEEVQKARFLPANKVISRGYTSAIVWLRLTIDPGTAKTVVLLIFPATLDEVTLFSPEFPASGPDFPTPGARYAGSQGKRLQWRTTLSVAPGPTIFYLRIKATGPMLVSLKVLSELQAQREEITRGIVLGAFLACISLIVIGLLARLMIRREALHMIFLLHLAVSTTLFLNAFGYLKEYVDLGPWFSSNIIGNFLALANVFTTFLFVRALLARFQLPRWGRVLFILFFVLYTPLFLFFFVLDRQAILFCSTALGVLTSALCLPLTFTVFQRHKSNTWVIGALIFLAMLFALWVFFMFFGIIAPSAWTFDFLAVRVVFLVANSGAILWLIDRERQDALHTSSVNGRVLRKVAALEKNRREIQERFMAMLMHELKSPLAIIQVAAASLGRHLPDGAEQASRISNINRSVDDLNAIIERCVQADQIEQGVTDMVKQNFSVPELLRDLLQTLGADRITLLGAHEFVIFSDYHYVRIILLNLLSNALKYSPVASMVEFQILAAPLNGVPGLTLSVSNTVGKAGMPDPSQVFVRYYRSDQARRYPGAGLGLWLAQMVARQLGSELHFQARQAHVVFSFWLALA